MFYLEHPFFIVIISNSISENTTPEELFVGVKRNLEPKGIFGCLVYAKNFVRGKQDNKSVKTVFLGYSNQYKSCMVRSIGTYKASLREYYARDVVFDVTQFPYKNILVPRPQVPPLDLEDEKEERELRYKIEKEEEEKEIILIDAELTNLDKPLPDLEEIPELTSGDSSA